MLNAIAVLGLGYLAGSGVVTNAAVVGRGLFRAARTAAGGDLREAAVEALGGLAAPGLMSYGALAGLCAEVIEAARSLAAPVRDEEVGPRAFDRAA
jgi:hypothetical protein